MNERPSFAAHLRAARAAANINQTQLAKACGYGQTNISKWERGFTTPTVDQVLVIARALGTTAADMMAGLDLEPLPKPIRTRTKDAPRNAPRRRSVPVKAHEMDPQPVTRRPGRQPPVEVI